MKKYLIILRQAPFKNSLSLEAQELSLALAAFEQNVSLLFIEDGVLQLLANQESAAISHKDFTKTYTGLDLFDIKNVYIEQTALERYRLNAEKLNIVATQITNTEISDLIAKHDIILTI